MTTAESVLKGQSLMTIDMFRSGDTWEQAKFIFEIVEAMVKRPFVEEEAKRLFDILFWSTYDFQSCDLLRNLFVLKNQGDLNYRWTDHLLLTKGKRNILDLLKGLGDRVVQAVQGREDKTAAVSDALDVKEKKDK